MGILVNIKKMYLSCLEIMLPSHCSLCHWHTLCLQGVVGVVLNTGWLSVLIKVVSNLKSHVLLNEKSFLNSKSLHLRVHSKAWRSLCYKPQCGVNGSMI